MSLVTGRGTRINTLSFSRTPDEVRPKGLTLHVTEVYFTIAYSFKALQAAGLTQRSQKGPETPTKRVKLETKLKREYGQVHVCFAPTAKGVGAFVYTFSSEHGITFSAATQDSGSTECALCAHMDDRITSRPGTKHGRLGSRLTLQSPSISVVFANCA